MISTASLLLVLSLAPADLDTDTRAGVRLLSDLGQSDRDTVFTSVRSTGRGATELLESLGCRRQNRQQPRLRIFAHEADFEDFRRRTHDQDTAVSSLSFYDKASREIVCTWQGGSAEAAAQLRRQCARQVLLQFATSPPIWFEEGFAGYFEGVAVDRYGDVMDVVNEKRLGGARQAIADQEYCPLFELMDLQHLEFYGLAGAQNSPWPRSVLYAQSWSLVFVMLESDEPVAGRFLALVMSRLDTGRWDQARFRAVLDEFEPHWIAFLGEDDFRRPGELVRNAWDELGAAEYFAARRSSSQALELEPASHSARRVLAWASYAEEEYETASAEFDRMIESRPDDTNALLGKTYTLLEIARRDQSPPDAELAIAAGRRAAAAAPAGEKHRGLVLAADAAELLEDWEQALTLVREALRQPRLGQTAGDELREREQLLIKRAIGR